MKRTRSILIDTTIGKIFANSASAQAADPSKLIAGSKLASASITSSKNTIAKITKNLSGNINGIRFINGGLVVNVVLTAAAAASGSSVIFDIKSGNTYETSTVISTLELPSSAIRASHQVALSIPTGNAIYVDIKQPGSLRPAYGLGIQFNYYSG